MILFSGVPGRVVAMTDKALAGASMVPLVTANPIIDFQSMKSIITRLTVSSRGNFQFLHTLGGDIYIYVFGERMGQMTLSGLSFASDCRDDNTNTQEHGLENMMDYYRDNCISTRSDPVTMLIGQSATVTGFIVGMDAAIIDPQLYLAQWSMEMMVVPEKPKATATS